MESKMVPRAGRGGSSGPRKYLIRWTVILGRDELEKMSGRPDALQKVLDHLNRAIKGSNVEIYRIVPIEEISESVRPGTEIIKPARPAGIAIAEGDSIEDIRSRLERTVEGISFGGLPVSVQNYLEFEINPLMEIGHGEKA
ncbi:MAG: hypothetical protein OK455_03230 [Thaumarchaeota archaeon]|nr:hypothetical protein [Nitrososphaerota archaeon]